MFDSKKAMLYTTVAISALLVVAAGVIVIKDKNERKKIGGRLIRVNYKFSKEFDDWVINKTKKYEKKTAWAFMQFFI